MAALMMTRNWTLNSIRCEQGATGRERGELGDSGQVWPRVLITRAACSDKADTRRSWEAPGQDQLHGWAPGWLQRSSGKEQG